MKSIIRKYGIVFILCCFLFNMMIPVFSCIVDTSMIYPNISNTSVNPTTADINVKQVDSTKKTTSTNETQSAVPEMAKESKSAILMSGDTGEILYEKNAHEKLEPASVTKIMTLLLVMEAIDDKKFDFNDVATCSEYAMSMGGSQIFLEAGEKMKVSDLVKSVCVSSANDACVTLAEHVAGSESAFVELMNNKAKELGLKNTSFENCTGLPGSLNLTTAYDIAIMSRELLKHHEIFTYTKIWMDTVRDGKFGLSNTNKLIRFYPGATGLKTGYTEKAGHCLSATANRDNMNLIAVVMGADSSNNRFNNAKELLNYGFANYSFYSLDKYDKIYKANVTGGSEKNITGKPDFSKGMGILIKKSDKANLKPKVELKSELNAPINKYEIIGRINLINGDNIVGEYPIKAIRSVRKLGIMDYFLDNICGMLYKK